MKYFTYFLFLGAMVLVAVFENPKNFIGKEKIKDSFSDMNKTNIVEELQGAWRTSYKNEKNQEVTITTIVMDGYIVETFYNKESKRFDKTFGGSWSADGEFFTFNYEFSSANAGDAGKTIKFGYDLKGDTITFEGDEKIWTRIDHGNTVELSGAWLFAGRKTDGEISRRPVSERKTMKMLSDSRFQWIAYHTGTGEFFGTGGGTYKAQDGKYTEQIEFFSRDSSRVGAILSFNYELQNSEWHHIGFSSKGDPLYEIWSPRIIMEEAKSNNIK